MQDFASNLVYYRKRAKLTQAKLASQLGLDQRSISAWEKGKATPSIQTIKKAAEVLNCNMDDLITEEKTEKKFDIPFTSSIQAYDYLNSIPLLSSISEINLDSLSEKELIDFANDVVSLLRIASKSR